MSPRKLLLLAASLLTAPGLRAAEEADRPGDLLPVTPVAQTRIGNLRQYGGMEESYALSPDGKTLVAAVQTALMVYDLSRSQPYPQARGLNLENVGLYNASVAFGPDGKTVLVGPSRHNQDSTVHFVSLESGKEVR
jgi:hypothetical protein